MRQLLQRVTAFLAVILPLFCSAEQVTPLGLLYLGQENAVELPLTNAGSSRLGIRTAETSCECLVPQFVPLELAPGETKLLRFAYRPIKAGRMRVDITYVSPDAAAPVKKESVIGVVVEPTIRLGAAELRGAAEADAVLVDVRRVERFQSAHLPRSLNLPLFALRLHAELKTKKVVLIDDGVSLAELAEEALKLRERGFTNVRVLNGGVAGWIRAGGAIEGTSRSAVEAALITPADFVRSQRLDSWAMVELGTAGNGIRDTGNIVHGHASRVLVIGANDSAYAAFEKTHGAGSTVPLFYLSGGSQALDEYKADQSRIAANPGAVFQSKSLQPHVVANTGCGTCPKRP